MTLLEPQGRRPRQPRATAAPGMPTSRTYEWMAGAVSAFAVYASLIPFRFQPVPVAVALQQFLLVMSAPAFGRLSRTNFLANVLLFVPIGFGLTGARQVDRATRAGTVLSGAGLTLLTSLTLSLTVEFLQIFVPGRVPARSDVEAQAVGCAVGLLAWLVMGPPLTRWLREAHAAGPGDRLGKALMAYAAAWVFVNLAPFDITFDLGELAERFRAGLVTMVPFAAASRDPSRVVWDALITTITAVPLGMLGLLGWTGDRGRRPILSAFAIAAGLILATEIAQIVIISHAADGADVLFGWLGTSIGVAIGRRVSPAPAMTSPGHGTDRAWHRLLLVGWTTVLLIYHWMPFDFQADPAAIRSKLAAMSLLPFVNYARGSDLNAFNDLLVKLGLAVPLGVTAALVRRSGGRRGRPLAGWLVAAAVVFSVIEGGQLFLPSRVPDPTDVLVGVLGTALGLAAGHWLTSPVPRS